MGHRNYLNRGWVYNGKESVDLPHTGCETNYNYINEKEFQMTSTYERELYIEEDWKGQILLLTFLGTAHDSEVFVNDVLVAQHHCGYTAFTIDITKTVQYGKMNHIKITLDSRETSNIPPFGNVIDYMTYQGLYRDVYLEVKSKGYIKDVFVTTNQKEYTAKIQLESVQPDTILKQYLYKKEEWDGGNESSDKAHECEQRTIEKEEVTISKKIENVEVWDVEQPNLYVLVTEVYRKEQLLDRHEVTFGFREISFCPDGFYLNGRKVILRGLNRHQSFPYVGYAMPKSMQVQDAKILKEELALNAVRTSHYPQSQDFIDACDELGLLVFTEIPGWQHIGDEEWQEVAIQNVKDMVQQYRNHPSICLWGTRINESPDLDSFYEKTNAAAKELDPSRETGGVRCIKNSHLLEDVYTYNDFSYGYEYLRKHGKAVPVLKNVGIDKRDKVTKHKDKAYLVSEYNGHMYPTKAFDDEEHRLQHALRHAQVINDIAASETIAGGFGWCMADYNTHKDFGSGDRICYHGVLDMFRNPKLAASVYASQGNQKNVLEISSSMDIGEHPAGVIGDLYAFTNADSLRLYKNGAFIKEYQCENKQFAGLKHPPVLIHDLIGNQLVEQENMSVANSNRVKRVIEDYLKYGMNLPMRSKLAALHLVLFSHFRFADAENIFKKYIGNWGNEATTYRFEAIKDGKVVKTVVKGAPEKVMLKTCVSSHNLVEDYTYDVAEVRIQAVDQEQNVLPYYQEPFRLEMRGAIRLIGPEVISLKGGMGGVYVRSNLEEEKENQGVLRIIGNNCEPVEITFTIKRNERIR